MLNPLDWLKSYALAGALIVAAGGLAWGGVQTYRLRGMQLEAAQALAKATQAAREKERLLNSENGKVTDELLKDRALAVAAAASSAERLRDLSRASSEAARACRRLDEPAVGVIRDDTREDLEREARRADQVTIQLTKLQDYVTRVCQLER
jgi:hypothetical protein